MDLREWSKSEIEYGRRLLHFGLEGARAGEQEFLHGEPLTPFVHDSARIALAPAAIGAFLGILSSLSDNQRRSVGKTILFGLLGGAIGFGTGMAWKSRGVTGSAARGALDSIHKVRDEHWVEKHPVAFA